MLIKEKKDLIIFGCSSFTDSIISLCNKISYIKVVAICVDDEYIGSFPSKYNNIHIISLHDAMLNYPNASYTIAVGYKNMRAREAVYNKLSNLNLHIETLISPNAHISTDSIGSGCIIFDGVVVEHGVMLNENITLWSNVTICHNAVIGRHSFIAANSTFGGFSKLGSLSFVGFNATVLDSIVIGQECLIGASTLINFNVSDFSKCFGVPGRVISRIEKDFGVCIV